MQDKIKSLLSNSIENLKNIIESENVVAKPIFINDTTYIIPMSKITVGFASGGGEYGEMQKDENLPFAGGNGGGLSITPIGVLVCNQGKHNFIKLSEKDNENKWADLVSSVINILK